MAGDFAGDRPILLWGSPAGVHCILTRHAAPKPFEVKVLRGDSLVRWRTFERDEDASAFAIAALRADDTLYSSTSAEAPQQRLRVLFR
jgi:hypothetical protein